MTGGNISMYRLPLYGQSALTADASATLLYLKGLKSSLIDTAGVFLMTRGPKNGFGGAELSTPLPLGDAGLAEGLGDVVVCQNKASPVSSDLPIAH